MNDSDYMRLALKLAARGKPSPNPYVGAVIARNGKIIGMGWHKKAGMPHAEIEALLNLKNPENAKGAVMYVNLEPCNHYGRTPPCTEAIIRSGIKRVVFAMNDPNPDVTGRGEEELRKRGINIENGILEREAKKLNEVFIKYSKTKMPFVVLKAAMSLDGKIATRTGDSKWITGKKAREYAHKLRSRYDAILVGINTVLKDNPQLTARIKGGRNPMRIILDNKLRIPLNANVLADAGAIAATTELHDKKKREKLEEKGVKVLVCGKERVDLEKLLKKLGGMGIASLLVEGGSEVHGSFVDAKLVDKFVLFYAPVIIGGKDAKAAVGGIGAGKIPEALGITGLSMKKIGNDVVFEGYQNY